MLLQEKDFTKTVCDGHSDAEGDSKDDLRQIDDNDNEFCSPVDDKESDIGLASPIIEDLKDSYRLYDCNKPRSVNRFNEKCKTLLSYEDAPDYLQHNSYILTGYRGILNTQLCLESVFWWTNETINIWSHLFGFLLFIALTVNDLLVLKIEVNFGDKLIVGSVLICFQACMFLSSLYHTFSCRSEKDCRTFLSYDLFGIALSLLAIYTSGIYYAFWCNQEWKNFYMITVTLIFIAAMVIQLPSMKMHDNVKMCTFVCWAAYGVVPTFHWTFVMGGFEHPLVRLLFPRVIGMYLISGIAFFIYLTKIPERFNAGKFDFLGHSHQWWHLLVVGALYYWHSTGMLYLEYRLNHACPGYTNSEGMLN